MNGNSSHAKLRKPPYFVPEENLIAIRSSVVMSVLFQKISIPPPPPPPATEGNVNSEERGVLKGGNFRVGAGGLSSLFSGDSE